MAWPPLVQGGRGGVDIHTCFCAQTQEFSDEPGGFEGEGGGHVKEGSNRDTSDDV